MKDRKISEMPEITKETHEFLTEMLYRWVQGFYDEPESCAEYDVTTEPWTLICPIYESIENELNRLKRIAADVGVEWNDILEREKVHQSEIDRVDEIVKVPPPPLVNPQYGNRGIFEIPKTDEKS